MCFIAVIKNISNDFSGRLFDHSCQKKNGSNYLTTCLGEKSVTVFMHTLCDLLRVMCRNIFQLTILGFF